MNNHNDDQNQHMADSAHPEAVDIVPQSAEAGQPDQLAALQSSLEAVKAQAAEYLDGWQRARAEFANFKKRMEAEREEVRSRCNEALLLNLLPVVDDFERAFQTVPPELSEVPWVNGVAMIWHKLQTLVESEKVVPIQAIGQPFDPQRHEAVMQEETTAHPDGTVVAEIRRGYQRGERVLRPALVKVANNPGAGHE
jgi:molecular chaperone GrpE